MQETGSADSGPRARSTRGPLRSVAVCLALAAGLGWWALRGTPHVERAAPTRLLASELVLRTRCQPALGARLGVRGTQRLVLQLDAAALDLAGTTKPLHDPAGAVPTAVAAQQQTARTGEIDFKLALEAAEPDGTSVWLRGDIRLDVRDKAAAPGSSHHDVPVALLLGQDCQLRQVQIAEAAVPRAAELAFGVLGALSFALPEAGDELAWTDALAEQPVQWVLRRDDEAGGVTGRLAAEQPAADPPPAGRPVLRPHAGLLAVRPGEGPWFGFLNRVQHERDSSRAFRAEVTTTASAEAVDAGWRRREAAMRPARASELAQRTVAADETDKDAVWRGRPLDDVWLHLNQMDDQGELTQKQIEVLSRWIRANPDQIAALVQRLHAGKLPDQRRHVQTVAALARSQHPAAVQAVLDMVRDPSTHGQLRFQATISASMDVHDVPDSLIDDLIRFGKDGSEYKGMAQLATAQLGTFYDLRHTDRPALAAKALQALQGRLQTDSGDGLQAALMGAGNSRATELYPAIVPHLTADDDTIEAQAWTALAGQPLPSLLEHFDALLLLATTEPRRAALFEAVGNALEANQAAVPPQVLAVALQLYGADGHALRPVSDLALLKVLGRAWSGAPGDPVLLAALRAKFAAAQASQHVDEIKAILAVVGIDQLLPGGAG